MLRVFISAENLLTETALATSPREEIAWIDLFEPSHEEELAVETLLGIDIPTRDEIREIEISNTLYQEKGAVFTTARLVVQSDTPKPELHPVSFILKDSILVTLRYAEPKAFSLFHAKATHMPGQYRNGQNILIDLLETIVGRSADGLESAARNLEEVNRNIFPFVPAAKQAGPRPKIDFQSVLAQIGGTGNLVSNISEGLISLTRMASYLSQTHSYQDDRDGLHHMEVMIKDLVSLTDYANSLAGKLGFLLEATLGMISIEQNAIIKIFSVGAVIFLPPTLIASIYGMNFTHMPELSWQLGYPLALGLMVFSAWLPYRLFKHKGWL